MLLGIRKNGSFVESREMLENRDEEKLRDKVQLTWVG